ncbi:Tumor necrosis factor receptor superfamily member 10B [Lonchura striata]|uniref:Tumor necrosis factor receptor superfamily member 6 n=2 Tax=Lonchura striata TaxID=40157 RepID=A0A218USP4_9PASE|nr:Tumor necrosis factor receptor superfamily member 10B [Lonchura striata domestica]
MTMPRARANCGEREYFHQGLCCVFCEAGTFVADHCSASHMKGKCDPCKEGKGFTAHANGLEGCLPCRQCREDQITLRSCTLTQNAVCKCKQGYFCNDDGCEICQRTSQRYPEKEILLNSTGASDPGLINQGKEALVWFIPVLLLSGLGLLVLVAVVVKKLKCNKAASTDKDVEGYLIREPSQITVKDLSQSELRETFDVFTKEVPPQQWKRLMRTLLQENDIDKIISKFPDNREEQSYQMLLIWKNRLGKKQCIINLLDALKHIDPKAYSSVSNALKSIGIISRS